jgi:methionyl-tRNA synthetase
LAFDDRNFSAGLENIWALIGDIGSFVDDNKPWGQARDSARQGRLAEVFYDCCEALRFVALLVYPVLPCGAEAIWKALGQTTRLDQQLIDEAAWGSLAPGTPIREPEPIYPLMDVRQTSRRIESLEQEIRESGETQPTDAAVAVAPSLLSPTGSESGQGMTRARAAPRGA